MATANNTATAAPAAPVPRSTPAALPTDPAASQVDFAMLAGKWKVVGVAPGDGVQAMAKDDPAYMGRVIDMSADRLAWEGPAEGGAMVGDRCDGPVTQHLTGATAKTYDVQFAAQLKALGVTPGDPHGIECDSGNWGPEAAGGATLYAQGNDVLALSWYDGVVLKLARQSGR
ncbi:hypothetical protein [Sphingomonas sp. Leaf412]|uniref:hypothetical protein n=1 Tax=Sphingomonas sp. Leaf412 TaxID=1736370 RepID=UPI0012E3AA20|nr:hypothetical protein [Sphingomonas sp. Leaf412]